MSGIVPDGCYLCSDQQSVFVPFVNVCQTSGDVRKELVALTNAARSAA
jgi:putative heme iron utilization protein